MSGDVVVVVPGAAAGLGGPPPASNPAGKLATTLLSVAVAGMAEPLRFRRGRTLLAERAVVRLEIAPGRLSGTVMGSRADPYQIEVRVALTARPAAMGSTPERADVMRLVPEAEQLDSFCSCPDDGDPCKHVVATLLCFADELTLRPDLLAHWRCGAAPARARATIGGRARAERHLRLVAPPPPPSPFATEAWRIFEGGDLPPVPNAAELLDLLDESASIRVPSLFVDRVDVGGTVRSALQAIAATHPTPRRAPP